MKAGIGRCELTPPLGVELAGYGYYIGRKAQSVRDPLYARALALSDGDTRALIVSCDVLGLNAQIAAQVREAVAPLGFGGDQVMLVSIHTHTGPCLIYHLGCGEVSPEYVATVAGRIIAACRAAVEDMADVTGVRSGLAPLAEPFAYNRALADGPVDPNVRGLLLSRRGAAEIAVVSYACHGVSLGRRTCVSADFSGEVHRRLAAKGIESIYLNGLCGDIDPITPEGENREARMLRFADAITDAFERGLAPAQEALMSGSVPFSLNILRLTKDEIRRFADQAVRDIGDEALPTARNVRIWEELELSKENPPATEELLIRYACIGDMYIVAFPFEGYTRIGELTRRALGTERAMTLGCADQLLGYLPTREDVAVGSYAALESAFHYQRMPPIAGEAERLGETVGKEIKMEAERHG